MPVLFESQFLFVNNSVLRANLISTMQYAIFLTPFAEKGDFSRSIRSMMYKNIIINIVSAIESLINYKLQELIKEERATNEEMMKTTYKYKMISVLYKVNENEIICGANRRTIVENINDNTMFVKLNRAARKCGLFIQRNFKDAEYLRDIRNKIHLAGIKEIDNRYSKNELNKVFRISNEIIKRIEVF